jgi:hypothetical protein
MGEVGACLSPGPPLTSGLENLHHDTILLVLPGTRLPGSS